MDILHSKIEMEILLVKIMDINKNYFLPKIVKILNILR